MNNIHHTPGLIPFAAFIRVIHNGYHYNLTKTLESLLKRQHPHGGFPIFVGFEDLFSPKQIPAEPEKSKWRAVIATPNWNDFTFELLSHLLKSEIVIQDPTCTFPLELQTEEGKNSPVYTSYENNEIVRFIHSKTNKIVFQLKKTDDVHQFGWIDGIRQSVRTAYQLKRYRKIIKALNLVL